MNHFKKEGYKERTIYNTIERVEDEGSLKDNLRTGRPPVLDTHQRKRLKRLVNNRTGVSQRRLGQKFQINQTTIQRALDKMHISCYKLDKTPRYTEKQAQESCRKLVNSFCRDSCSVIMDDEKYLIFYGQNMLQNACYFTDNKDSCPDNVRFHGIEKYPRKTSSM